MTTARQQSAKVRSPVPALGLPEGLVRLRAHNPLWLKMFREQRTALLRLARATPIFAEVLPVIEHVGSTAIPGLPAKPILDIAVFIQKRRQVWELASLLGLLGYEYMGEFGLVGRDFFVRGDPVTHHLHVVAADNTAGKSHWRDWLCFRDFLLKRPDEARGYAVLKRRNARIHANDRSAYTRSKTACVAAILKRARQI